MTLLGAGIAGLLVWLAVKVGQHPAGHFWASMAIIAGAGLVMAFSQLLGGWTKWGLPRLSAGVFTIGFLPVLVCVGWILMATQPGSGWHEATVARWSHHVGILGLVHELGLYHGVLAFGFGLVLGFSFDTTGPRRLRGDRVVAEERAPRAVPVPHDQTVTDEPVVRERDEVARPVPADSVSTTDDTQLVGGQPPRSMD
jgi:hypothetical protein